MLFRSAGNERPDPMFQKYFAWPTRKDPKGTVKNNVLEVRTTSLPVPKSRGQITPSKKKIRRTINAGRTKATTDEDFILLESFLAEIFPSNESAWKSKAKYEVIIIVKKI